MKYHIITSLLLLLVSTSCYKTVSIKGFDKDEWTAAEKNCNSYRLEKAALLIANEKTILGSSQNEIESLLGKAMEHELYNRNQKFFHYRLTPPDSCKQVANLSFLSIRFNALGNASEVQVTVREQTP